MRPTLSLPKLFGPAGKDPRDTIPDDMPDTERETIPPTGRSGQVVSEPKVPADRNSYIGLRHQPVAHPPSCPAHALVDLDAFLAARLLRLEVTSMAPEAGAFLALGRVLRAALGSAGTYADPHASDKQTFEARLGETLRGVYGWAYGAFDAAFLAEHVRPLPKRVVTELSGLAEEAVKLSRFEGVSYGDLAALLRDVRRTSSQMAAAAGPT